MPHSPLMLNVFDWSIKYKISGNSHAYFLMILQALIFLSTRKSI